MTTSSKKIRVAMLLGEGVQLQLWDFGGILKAIETVTVTQLEQFFSEFARVLATSFDVKLRLFTSNLS